jgi:hypothetical protein
MKWNYLIDRLLFLSFLAGICILTFILGAVCYRYKLTFHKTFQEAFIVVDEWLEEPTPLPKKEIFASETLGEVQFSSRSTWNDGLAYSGYTLVTTGFSTSAFLVNMKGETVHRWDAPFDKVWVDSEVQHDPQSHDFLVYAHLLSNGDLIILYGTFGDKPYGYGVVKLDKDSNVLWRHAAKVHHASNLDEKGNIYFIEQETLKEPMEGFEGLIYPMLADNIVKLSADGQELGRISLLKAFQGTPYEFMMYHGQEDGDSKYDFFHTNSVEILNSDIAAKFPQFRAGSLLVSIRAIGVLAVIDPDTSKVVWAVNGPWSYQHAASFLPNGNLMVFDNRGQVENEKVYSRLIEFNPLNLQAKWLYKGSKENPFFSQVVGRLQRLANGNTLIAESTRARILEVTDSSEIVWSYALHNIALKEGQVNYIFTASRYEMEELGFLNNKAQQK